MYTSAATPVTVIFISDGARGGRTEAGKSRRQAPADELAKTRRREAELAIGLLGVTDSVFLDLPDGQVRANKEHVDRLLGHLSVIRPDLVFLPFMVDQHADHLATNALFLEAAAGVSPSLSAECWGYEVWTPLYANRLVDITVVADTKWEAIRQYTSQATNVDYLTSVQGLNAFRQRTAYRASGYTEAFFAASLTEYRALYQRMMASR
jgi:LmbE family N-acetylglucosaminyl deacetylase